MDVLAGRTLAAPLSVPVSAVRAQQPAAEYSPEAPAGAPSVLGESTVG